MTLKIEIALDNSAFEDGEITNECKRAINAALEKIRGNWEIGLQQTIRDSNGNKVGTAEVVA